MLEMVIFKSQGGRSLVNQFSNSYLFNGAPNYLSDAAFTVLNKLAQTESRIYFDDTNFMRGIIRQLDAEGNHIEGETRTVPLNLQGANALDIGSVIVPPNIVVGYEKRPLVGRSGVTLYRNVLSSDEYNLYLENGTVPPRLNTVYAPGALPPALFSTALLNAEGDTGLDMMLPVNRRYAAGAARPVQSIAFGGIRFRQETFQKESGAENLEEAVQQLINENGRAIRRLVRQMPGAVGEVLRSITATIIQLVTQALARYAVLSIAGRARIFFPAIYRAAEVLALMP